MRYLIIVSLLFLTACAADGSFQMPNIMVEDKKSGNLVGCHPVPSRNIQICEYEDGRFKFTTEIPLGAAPEATVTPTEE
ncbi:MAG: hypothetical protein ACXABY_27765 [Candidatus Thorarchaeota archaeon]